MFSVFSSKQYNTILVLQQIDVKNIHLVSGAGTGTRDLVTIRPGLLHLLLFREKRFFLQRELRKGKMSLCCCCCCCFCSCCCCYSCCCCCCCCCCFCCCCFCCCMASPPTSSAWKQWVSKVLKIKTFFNSSFRVIKSKK